MIKSGQSVAPKIVPQVPVVPLESVADANLPGIQASAPVLSLLTPEQIQLALPVS